MTILEKQFGTLGALRINYFCCLPGNISALIKNRKIEKNDPSHIEKSSVPPNAGTSELYWHLAWSRSEPTYPQG